MSTPHRVYNFSAGPAVMPLEVLETVRENILSYQGSGIGVMELSHRSKAFDEIIQSAEANFRKLLDVPADYAVLFLTGGASTQFSMVPMNLLQKGQTADYFVTGYWAERAAVEAKKFGEVNIAASSENKNHCYIPTDYRLSDNCSFVHYTSNNTIYGTQFHREPVVGERVLVCDASSDLLHKKVDVKKYGVIYAGAQKNLGPAGTTIVIIREDLLSRIPKNLPVMLDYNTHVKGRSVYNTPPTFPIYVVGEMFKWLLTIGGLGEIEKRNREKAKVIYDAIDGSSFYTGHAEKGDRSLMNITFRIKNNALEPVFLKEAQAAGFFELQGHRNVGGIRASIYNAFPLEGVVEFSKFMADFAQRNG